MAAAPDAAPAAGAATAAAVRVTLAPAPARLRLNADICVFALSAFLNWRNFFARAASFSPTVCGFMALRLAMAWRFVSSVPRRCGAPFLPPCRYEVICGRAAGDHGPDARQESSNDEARHLLPAHTNAHVHLHWQLQLVWKRLPSMQRRALVMVLVLAPVMQRAWQQQAPVQVQVQVQVKLQVRAPAQARARQLVQAREPVLAQAQLLQSQRVLPS